MGWLLRSLLVPFTTSFAIAAGIWNRSGDWGWHITLRIAATVLFFCAFLFFFYWSYIGYQWPPF